MRVSTSKLTYVVFHMSLLQVAWGLTLVAQVCQKTFDYIIRVHIHVLLHAFATKLPGGHPVRGLKFGARLLWHRYGIRTRWIETHVCSLLLLWDEARNPII